MRFTNGVSATEYPCFLGEKQNFVLSVLKSNHVKQKIAFQQKKKKSQLMGQSTSVSLRKIPVHDASQKMLPWLHMRCLL